MDKYAPPISLGEDITVDYGFVPNTTSQEGYSDIGGQLAIALSKLRSTSQENIGVTATDFFGRITSDTINVNFLNLYTNRYRFCYHKKQSK